MQRTALVVIAGVCGVSTPVGAQLASGCFDAEFGAWTPIEGTHTGPREREGPPSETGDSLFYAFPPRVELTRAPTSRSSAEWYRLDVPPNALQVPKPFRAWHNSGDSLLIRLGDGFTSVNADLVWEGEVWSGELRMRSDNFGVQLYSRALVLSPVDCRTDPPIPASADAPAPRVVTSVSGPPLALGELIPSEYDATPVRSFLWLGGFRASGYWAGSDSVLVRTNPDGLISHIEVRYPEGFTPDRLEAGLLDEFGAGRPDPSELRWWNRTTRASLAVGGRVIVLLADPRMDYY